MVLDSDGFRSGDSYSNQPLIDESNRWDITLQLEQKAVSQWKGLSMNLEPYMI